MKEPLKIVFVDGYCTLCNKWVRFIAKRDRKKEIYFTSIQGLTAQKYLSEADRNEVNYIQYFRKGELLVRSNAVLWILRDLGGFWKIFGIFQYLPRFMRDSVYGFVAKRRYRWHAKKDSCEINPGVGSKNILP
jgi:predicted DCC family thiol-disulfide oxidoreductase YuxK